MPQKNTPPKTVGFHLRIFRKSVAARPLEYRKSFLPHDLYEIVDFLFALSIYGVKRQRRLFA